MHKLIDLGDVMESTRGCEYSSIAIDPGKRVENGIRYRTAPPELADQVMIPDPN